MNNEQTMSEIPMPASLTICVCLVVGFWMSCVGTEVGNPQTIESEIEFSGYEHEDARALTLESGITIDRAWLNVESIEFSDAADCDGQEISQMQGPFAFDLLGGRELPSKPILTHHGEGFCKMKVRLRTADVLVDGSPDELLESSLFIEGTYEDGTSFTIAAELNATYVLAARDERGFVFDRDSHPLVGIALDTLVDATLLDESIDRQEDGSVLVDKNNNQNALSGLRRDLRASFRLFDDREKDGEVDPEVDLLLAEGELSP